MDYLLIGTKLLVGFFGLLIVMRLLGKKELSQLTPFDIVYSVVFGGILEESLYDEKIEIWHLLFGITVWGVCIYLVELLAKKYPFPRKLLKGEWSVLVNNGEFNDKELKKNKIEMEQLRTMLRQANIFSIRQVKYLILEPGGQISIQKYDAYETPTKQDLGLKSEEEELVYLVINEGKVNVNELKSLKKDEDWLFSLLAEEGYSEADLNKIIYGEWSRSEGLYLKLYED